MVSYPLLLDEAGEVRAPATREWLASRTFIALDGEGRVVVGTTRSGFFTLRRLGEYLKASPLGPARRAQLRRRSDRQPDCEDEVSSYG